MTENDPEMMTRDELRVLCNKLLPPAPPADYKDDIRYLLGLIDAISESWPVQQLTKDRLNEIEKKHLTGE